MANLGYSHHIATHDDDRLSDTSSDASILSIVPNTYTQIPQTMASYVAGRERGSSRSISLV